MFVLDGKTLALDVPFSHDGVNYPANWLRLASPEEREAIGITEEPDPQPYDQRFYWGYDNNGNLIPKDHSGLIDLWVSNTKTTAGTLLSQSDWMVVREFDSGIPVDAPVRAYRAAVREASQAKVELIQATSDTQGLAEYVMSSEYSEWPSIDESAVTPSWTAFYQALLISEAFTQINIAARTNLDIAVGYADTGIALTQATMQKVNAGAIQACFDNLLGLLTGDSALTQSAKDELVEIAEDTGVDDVIQFNFAA